MQRVSSVLKERLDHDLREAPGSSSALFFSSFFSFLIHLAFLSDHYAAAYPHLLSVYPAV